MKSIEFKSIECFNILLNNNIKFIAENYYNSIEYHNELSKAIELYINSDNIINKFYINKLLEKNIQINYLSIELSISDFELFKILFR